MQGLADLRTALEALYQEEGVETKHLPNTAKVGLDNNEVQWVSAFGRLTFRVQGFTLGDPKAMGRINSYAQINLDGHRPSQITVHIKFELPPGIRLFDCRKKAKQPDDKEEPKRVPLDVTKQGQVLPFTIEIEWSKPPKGWPQNKPFVSVPTLHRIVRDIDFVLLDEREGDDKGMFIQLQPSLFSCHGRLYFGMQTVFAGQVATTTPRASKRALELGLSTETVDGKTAIVVPVFNENAWQGCDFLKIDGMAREIVPIAIKQGISTPLGRTHPAKWEPSLAELRPRDHERLVPADESEGLVVGTVLWFNLDMRIGVAMCPDGVTCFIHFKSICNGDYQPTWQKDLTILEPGRAVALFYGPGREASQRKALTTIALN